MLDILYFYLRGAVGAALILAGISLRLPQKAEKSRMAFGGLLVAVGALYTMSALDPDMRLPVDLDNLVYQALMLVLGLSLLDLSLYLFGSERHKGSRGILARVGISYEILLVLLPLLDYALGLQPSNVNVEDGLVRGPIHAAAIEAAYLWPIAATLIAITLAKWKPSDITTAYKETRRLITALACLVPLLVAVLVSLVLSLQLPYRIGQLVMEFLLVAWYFYVVRNPQSLALLRQEIGKEHARRLKLPEAELSLIEERLSRLSQNLELILDEELDLKRLASHIGVPAYRLSAYFGSRLKTTFPVWRNAIRIDFVKARMAERPDLSVLDISVEAGYRSKAAFNEQFSRLVGMSPSEYRKGLKS